MKYGIMGGIVMAAFSEHHLNFFFKAQERFGVKALVKRRR